MTASIAELLDRLGSTADDVAATLHAQGITGAKGCANSCAIANYLASLGVTVLAVGCSEEDGYFVDADDDYHVIGHDGPIPDFIRAFDQGAYPHLIEAEVD